MSDAWGASFIYVGIPVQSTPRLDTVTIEFCGAPRERHRKAIDLVGEAGSGQPVRAPLSRLRPASDHRSIWIGFTSGGALGRNDGSSRVE